MANDLFGVSYKVKKFFFDREKVINALERKTAKALTKAGMIIRQRARRMIKNKSDRDLASTAPAAPFAHETKSKASKVFTLRNILFAFQPATTSVIVGPVRLSGSKKSFGGVVGNASVPALHEFGGTRQIREKLATIHGEPTWITGNRPPAAGQPTRIRSVKYPARPFMRPSLEQAAPHLNKLWGVNAGPVNLFGG